MDRTEPVSCARVTANVEEDPRHRHVTSGVGPLALMRALIAELGGVVETEHFIIRYKGDHAGGADGVLGLDTLQDQHVLLDFEQNRIALTASDEAETSGYEIVVRARRKLGQLVIADARIDGIKVAVIIDTGAQGSIGNLALQNRMRSRDRGTTDLTDINGVTASGEIGIARRLDLGRARIESFPIVYHDAPPFRALGLDDRPAMVLGMGELRLFKRVAIDFNRRRILFDMPDSPRRNRSGTWFAG